MSELTAELDMPISLRPMHAISYSSDNGGRASGSGIDFARTRSIPEHYACGTQDTDIAFSPFVLQSSFVRGIFAPLRVHVAHIIKLSARKNMAGIATSRRVALVAGVFFAERSIRHLIRKPMSVLRDFQKVKPAVSHTVLAAIPQPTIIWPQHIYSGIDRAISRAKFLMGMNNIKIRATMGTSGNCLSFGHARTLTETTC